MKRILFAVFAFFILGQIYSCTSSNQKSSSGQSGSSSGELAAMATFNAADLTGGMHSFNEYKGKSPLVVNFWGTWCPPCRRELPDLKRIYSEFHPKGLEIVSLAVKDTPDKVRTFSQENGMDWVMLMANQDAMMSFNVNIGIPTTIFFNKEGVEVGRVIGETSYDGFRTELAKIM